jgi:imidazolonepropionase-like amidohydrolase
MRSLTRSRWILSILLGALAVLFQGSLTGAAQDQAEAVTVFRGATLIDGTGRPAIEKSVLVIQGDHIIAAGKQGKVHYAKSAKVIDAEGKTIIPGLINAHGHLGMVLDTKASPDAYTAQNVKKELLQYEQYGVTSMLSMGFNADLLYDIRQQQKNGEVGGASIFTADRGFGVPDGMPPQVVGSDRLYRPATPEEARADVRAAAARHPDIIKMWVDDGYGRYPKMRPEIYKAIIDESHKQGLRVAAHIVYLEDARALVADGLDVLAHSVRDKTVDPGFIQMVKARNVLYIPTFTVEEAFFIFCEHPEVMADPFFRRAVSPNLLKMFESSEYREKVESNPDLARHKAALTTALRNVKLLSDAGVRIAMGTDSGAFPARVPGWAEHREMELMVQAGLTPMQTLVAATKVSAEVLGASDRGILEAGKRADFLVLATNPLDDIRNTRKIVSIWHGGREVKPRVPAPALEAGVQ